MNSELFPETTVVRDYAYEDPNPLRDGQYQLLALEDDDEYVSTQTFVNDGLEEDEEYEFEEGSDDGDNMEINQRAIALFDFVPENDNEVGLTEGQMISISYRHGQGWLVAEDPTTGENGLVPEEYVEILEEEVARPFKPEIFGDEWVDTDSELEAQEPEGKEPIEAMENLSVNDNGNDR